VDLKERARSTSHADSMFRVDEVLAKKVGRVGGCNWVVVNGPFARSCTQSDFIMLVLFARSTGSSPDQRTFCFGEYKVGGKLCCWPFSYTRGAKLVGGKFFRPLPNQFIDD
jgi:hypothetical protein